MFFGTARHFSHFTFTNIEIQEIVEQHISYFLPRNSRGILQKPPFARISIIAEIHTSTYKITRKKTVFIYTSNNK